MRNLRWQAKLYIWCTIFAGTALYLWYLWHLQVEHPILLVILTVFAIITHTLKVEGTTARSSYQISWIAYGASFVLINPSEAMSVLLVAHIAQWLWHKSEWYIALFNVNVFGVVAAISILVWQSISYGNTPFAPISALGLLATAAIFTVLNHLLVGLVIWLARGENLMRSGVFHLLTLMIDFVSFGMGIASGLIWLVNPYAVVFILSPLYLIYTTLQVPSLIQQARIESNTGLYNAKYFGEALKEELKRSHRFNRPLTVVMAGINNIDFIRRTHGRVARDAILWGVSKIFQESVREYDVVAMLGGDDIGILMPETSLKDALPLIEQMCSEIKSAVFKLNLTSTQVVVSFGLVQYEGLREDAEYIVNKAEQVLSHSMLTKGNSIHYLTNNRIHEYSETAELDSPYIVGIPLAAEQEIFVGRTDTSERIVQLLLDRRRPSLLLYGQRRMGKTSLLNNLGRLLPSTIIPLFVDLQGPATRADEYSGLLYNVARGMVESAQRQRGFALPALLRESLATDPFTVFDEWLDRVEHALGDHTALLMLDEFEALESAMQRGRYDEEDIFGLLRHLIQHRPRFKVLLAGSHTLDEYQRWASYLINVQTVHISYLKTEEARQLIERPVKEFTLRYEANASQRIIDLTRCHPFLVQLLCSELVALKNEQDPSIRRLATLADVEAAVPEALAHGSMFFADIEHNQVNEAGRTLLRHIAAGGEGGIMNRAQLAQVCHDDIDNTLKLLQQRELIESAEGGYRFQVELIRRWFAQ